MVLNLNLDSLKPLTFLFLPICPDGTDFSIMVIGEIEMPHEYRTMRILNPMLLQLVQLFFIVLSVSDAVPREIQHIFVHFHNGRGASRNCFDYPTLG